MFQSEEFHAFEGSFKMDIANIRLNVKRKEIKKNYRAYKIENPLI